MTNIKAAFPKMKRFRKSKEELIIEYLGGKCKECSSTENLELDHIVPLSKGGEDSIEDPQVLCAACHIMKSYHEGTFPVPRIVRRKLEPQPYKSSETESATSSHIVLYTDFRTL